MQDNMMCGIVTFHDGINFGAYLQTYALHKYLLTLGIGNEVLNYKGLRHWFNEYYITLHTKNPILFAAILKKISKFKEAEKRINKTTFHVSTKPFTERRYKALFFGSDEIWNFRQRQVGFNPFYFGEGLHADRLISYAASCGNLTEETVVPDKIKKLLSRFHYASVRDESSKKIIEQCIGKQVEIVVDPTLLYDFESEAIDCPYKDYILIYSTLFDREMKSKLKQYARAKGKKLISIGYYNDFCDMNEISIGPFEFLGLIKKADMVVTSMFHGVLLSVKYNKNVSIIVDPYRVNKLSTILKILSLEGKVYRPEQCTLERLLEEEIDYAHINAVLNEERAKSADFIRNALGMQ
ncbi:MAG: polysaccharide pyruvyl transferase family protein [Nitrospirota bacterium]